MERLSRQGHHENLNQFLKTAEVHDICLFFDDMYSTVTEAFPRLSFYDQMKSIALITPERISRTTHRRVLDFFYSKNPVERSDGVKALFYLNLKTIISIVEAHSEENVNPDDLFQSAVAETIDYFRSRRFTNAKAISSYVNRSAINEINSAFKAEPVEATLCDSFIQPEEEVFQSIFREINADEFMEVLQTVNLSARNIQLLMYLYGSEEGKRTLKEASQEFKITTPRISQILRVARVKVTEYYKNKDLIPIIP